MMVGPGKRKNRAIMHASGQLHFLLLLFCEQDISSFSANHQWVVVQAMGVGRLQVGIAPAKIVGSVNALQPCLWPLTG